MNCYLFQYFYVIFLTIVYRAPPPSPPPPSRNNLPESRGWQHAQTGPDPESRRVRSQRPTPARTRRSDSWLLRDPKLCPALTNLTLLLFLLEPPDPRFPGESGASIDDSANLFSEKSNASSSSLSMMAALPPRPPPERGGHSVPARRRSAVHVGRGAVDPILLVSKLVEQFAVAAGGGTPLLPNPAWALQVIFPRV